MKTNKNNNNPAKTAESTTTMTAKQRLAARRKIRLLKSGMTEAQIEELANEEKTRIITCLLYGSYTVDLGTRKVKKDKKEVEIPNILTGQRAAQYTLGENKVTVLRAHNNYVIIKSNVDDLEKDSAILESMGRIQVTKLQPKQEKPKKEKKPTANTAEVKKAAKKKRKAANMEKVKNREFYKMRKKTSKRGSHAFARSKSKLTLADIKAKKRANKVGKAIIKAEEIKAAQAKKKANNDKKRQAAARRAAAKKEQQLKLAA